MRKNVYSAAVAALMLVVGGVVVHSQQIPSTTASLASETMDIATLQAAIDSNALPAQEVAIRGRNEPMIVRTVIDARTLSALVDGEQSAAA